MRLRVGQHQLRIDSLRELGIWPKIAEGDIHLATCYACPERFWLGHLNGSMSHGGRCVQHTSSDRFRSVCNFLAKNSQPCAVHKHQQLYIDVCKYLQLLVELKTVAGDSQSYFSIHLSYRSCLWVASGRMVVLPRFAFNNSCRKAARIVPSFAIAGRLCLCTFPNLLFSGYVCSGMEGWD